MVSVRLRGRDTSLVALLVLLALATVAAGSFVHTDDGCAVEQHCRACRVALASAGAAPPDVPQLAFSAEAELVSVPATAAYREASVASALSRGPPLAL